MGDGVGYGDGEKGKFFNKGKKLLKGETSSLPVTKADLEKEDVGKKDQETPFELKNLKMSVLKMSVTYL